MAPSTQQRGVLGHSGRLCNPGRLRDAGGRVGASQGAPAGRPGSAIGNSRSEGSVCQDQACSTQRVNRFEEWRDTRRPSATGRRETENIAAETRAVRTTPGNSLPLDPETLGHIRPAPAFHHRGK